MMHTILSFSVNLEGVVRIHDAVQCLAKFSDTVSLEARSDCVRISLQSITTFVLITFQAYIDNAKLFEIRICIFRP